MCKRQLALVVSVALFAWSQGRVAAVVLTQLPSLAPRLDKGFVQDNTYKNASLGLELTIDPTLKFGIPESKGDPGAPPRIVMIAAWGQLKPFSAREGTLFYADSLAHYPGDQRSTNAYMRRVVRANETDGFKRIEGTPEGNLGGVLFARTDFSKKGPIYEAVLVKACETHAFVFVFSGSTREAVNKLIAGTELKLELSTSGCSSQTNGVSQK